MFRDDYDYETPEQEDARLERAWRRRRQRDYSRCLSCSNPDSMYFDQDPSDYLDDEEEEYE